MIREAPRGTQTHPNTPDARRSCRFCSSSLEHSFADLGVTPLANAYVTESNLSQPEVFYPLHAYVCQDCLLVQLEEFESPEGIFGDYAYFSSYSDSWLRHAERYVENTIERFQLRPSDLALEIASNDGYLLRHLVDRGIPVLGIEPAANVAEAAEALGIPTLVRFFGQELAREMVAEGTRPDLIIANNVLAHVPDLNDFVLGMKLVLAPGGVATLEFPHLLQMVVNNQFDTIYHEHFSYFSFLTVERVFQTHGLTLFDVEELPTHGGSLRIYACHAGDRSRPVGARVEDLRRKEALRGLDRIEGYLGFEEQIRRTKRRLLAFLIEAREAKKSVVGYGAPAKGNTLLNFCGVRNDLIDFTVDRSPHKQGRYLPGTRIPIFAPDRILDARPDYVLILPWNLKDEIMEQASFVRDWGGRFVTPVPTLEIHS